MFTDKLNQFNQALNVNLTHSNSVNGAGAGSPNTGFFEPITGQIGSTGCNLLIIALFALAIGVTLFVLRHKFHKLHKASLVASLCIFAFGATALATAGSLNAHADNTGRVADAANAVTMNLTTTPEGATTTASAHATLGTDFNKGYIIYAYVDQDPMLWNNDYSDAIDITWPAASINDLAMNSYGIQNQDGSFDLPSIDAKKPTKIAETTNYGFAGSNLPINYALRADTTLAEGGYSTLTYAMHYQVVPNVYKLTYDYGDVAPVKTVTQDHNPIFTVKVAEDRAGYTFNGYTRNENRIEEDAHNYIQPGSEFVADYVDTTLYASWTANTYKATFDTNGGQFPSGKTRTIKDEVFDSKYIMPKTTPTRTGYTFTGWYTAQDGGDKIDNESIVSTPSDHTIYAHWEAKQSTAYFDANGGEFAPGETVRVKTETYGEKYVIPDEHEQPTRIGYQFAGWFTAKDGGTHVTTNTTVTTTTDHTLYAHWTANTYKLSYDANGGDNAPVAQEQSGNPTFKVKKAQPTRTGYTFKGWATTKEATASEYAAGSSITLKEPETGNVSEQTLYAVWEIQTYQVEFDANGGEFTPGETVRVKTETYGEKYVIPDEHEQPTRIGYQFAGWFTAKDGGTHVTTNTTVTTTTDHTLYAHWTANTYKLSYDANGGTDAPVAQEQSGNPTFVVTADVPKLKGHKLLGWSTKPKAKAAQYHAGDSITLSEPESGDTSTQTLYAVWEAKAYSVTFSANGGEFAPTETTKTIDEVYGEPYKLPEIDPTQTGYKFVGWFTQPVGGEQVTAETTVAITQATTLYAHWQREQYVVTFDANNGRFPDESDSQKIKITYLDNYQLPEKNPKREGYKFIGWYTEKDGGIKITSKTQMTTAKKHTLYAHWQARSYDVTYDANGGKFADGQTTDGPHSLAFDSPYVLPQQEVKRTGYTFKGWWTEKDGGDEITDTTLVKIAKEHTIYAHWTANQYTVTFDANGGAFEGDAKSEQVQETYDDNYVLPATNPTLDDYKFLGWFTEKVSGKQITRDNIMHTANNDRVLYAHWGKDLVFDANGGIFRDGKPEFIITETLNAHMVLPEPEKNPTHPDSKYFFAGWWTEKDGGKPVTTDNFYNKATRLYAHWSTASPATTLSQQYPVASAAPVTNVPHYENTVTPPVTRSRTSRVAR